MLLFVALACSGTDPDGAPTPTETGTETDTPFTSPPSQVITVETRDGVTLEADLYPTDIAGGPAFVLLHMIPPGNDRTTWPTSFIDDLVAQRWAVVAVDRRGAGGSEGDPVDAYEGDTGRYDVEAVVLDLRDRGYVDIAIIGASNGTTSLLDYTAWAGDEGLPVPVALGFMTGGEYTENQNPMSALPPLPTVFTYSTAERAWSVAQQPLDPGSWSFLEYDGGDHGTRMFDAKPKVGRDLVDFFVDILGAG